MTWVTILNVFFFHLPLNTNLTPTGFSFIYSPTTILPSTPSLFHPTPQTHRPPASTVMTTTTLPPAPCINLYLALSLCFVFTPTLTLLCISTHPAMVIPKGESLITKTGLTSVGPGNMTGTDVVHEPTGMDLSTKLHYLRGVYFFRSDALAGITMKKLKDAMFYWLNDYSVTCGRFRRTKSGRPFIKCNDCGARVIEARCDTTIDEWLKKKDYSASSLLYPQQVIGPELAFSPSLLFQYTSYKCGGISLGLSWAHVLGDVYSVSEFMNALTGFISGSRSTKSLTPTAKPISKYEKLEKPPPMEKEKDPLSLRRVEPVGDHWITVNGCKMEGFSFPLSSAQIKTLKSEADQIPLFESICALLWHCIGKVRSSSEPRTVTLCKRSSYQRTEAAVGNNRTMISTAEADFSITQEDPKRLAEFLASKALDETAQIENAVEKDNGAIDFILYGANLTFVDWEDVDMYGFELNKHKPAFVHYSIEGVGEEGAVLVHPWPKNNGKDEGDGDGRLVTVILPENEMPEVKIELAMKGLI